MRVGFNGRDAYNMYRSLAKEVLGYYNYDAPTPKFRAFDYADTKTKYYAGTQHIGNSYATTWFVDFEALEARLDEPPSIVTFNTPYLEYMYEDELIGVIIHELAHVVTGFWTYHGEDWAACSREVGGQDQPILVLRNNDKLPEHLQAKPDMVKKYGVYYA